MSVIYIRNAETGKFEPVLSLQGPPGNVGPEGPQGPPGEGVLPPLVGTTDEVTPTQVYEAIREGRDVRITATYSTIGKYTFTSFSVKDNGGDYHSVYATSQEVAGATFYKLAGHTAANQWVATQLNVATTSSKLPNPHKLEFKGAVLETYDGSTYKEINIPTVPEKLPNPNALTIKDSSGRTLATYDGSQVVTLELPESGGGSGGVEAPTIIQTTDAKPSEVAPYIQMGAKVWIQHIDATYGLLIFTSYVIQSADGENFTLVCSAVFNLDGTPTLGQLVGGYITGDTWQFSVTPLAMPVV